MEVVIIFLTIIHSKLIFSFGKDVGVLDGEGTTYPSSVPDSLFNLRTYSTLAMPERSEHEYFTYNV